MKKYTLKDPLELSRDKVAEILRSIQEFIYLDLEKERIDPELYVSDADLGMFIEQTMWENGLSPREVSPKDWSPKDPKKFR